MSRRLIVSLSTIFKVRGGIPRFNQMLCLALDELAPQMDLDVLVLSQDDDEDDYRAAGAPWKHLRFAAGHGKVGLTKKTVAASIKMRPDLLMIGILGMTPMGLPCAPFLKRGFGFIAHGMECWPELDLAPPKPSRAFAARRSTFVLSVSYSAKAFINKQP